MEIHVEINVMCICNVLAFDTVQPYYTKASIRNPTASVSCVSATADITKSCVPVPSPPFYRYYLWEFMASQKLHLLDVLFAEGKRLKNHFSKQYPRQEYSLKILSYFYHFHKQIVSIF